MDDTKQLLEQILTAQILILGKAIKTEKAAKGVRSTSDYTYEAATLIQNSQSRLLELLR